MFRIFLHLFVVTCGQYAPTRGRRLAELRGVPCMSLSKTGDGPDVGAAATLRVVSPVSSTVAHAIFTRVQRYLVALHDGTKVSREFLASDDNVTGL